MNNVSIQGDQRYIDFEFELYTIPVALAAVPLIYLVPTTVLLFKILSVYFRMLLSRKEDSLNPHVFFVIVLSQFANLCYVLSDYFTIRVPSTGIITSWCASQQPSHLLKLLFFFSVYFNYTAMLFPFLLSVLRLIPIHFPGRQNEICSRIVYTSTPLIFLYPFLFSFFLYPALGFCRQLLGPWPFGSIYIFFSGSWHDMKLANFLFFNVIFWLAACIFTNFKLHRKLRKLKNKRRSVRLQRAELSVTMTSFSMLISYASNLIFIILFIVYPPLATYAVALRPFGNDCEFVFVPWIFYLTHPTFKKKLISAIDPMNNESIHGDPRYIAYQFQFFTLPVFITILPLIYLIPTTVLIFKILSVYARMLVTKWEESLNPNVFFVIVLSQFANFCYVIADYFTIRIPATGVMTAWCASQGPSHLLKVIFFFSVYFNYTSMLFPFLLSVLRLVPIYSLGRHNELSAKIVYISTPLIFVYPFLFSFFLIPALGVCRQLLAFWPFGSIYLFHIEAWHDMKLASSLFSNVIFWLCACIVTNITLYRKLNKLNNKRKSPRLQRAELSVTLTSSSMLISYISNLVFIIAFIIYQPLSSYVVAFRPFGNDCDFVLVPWIFYLSHPIFKNKMTARREISKIGIVAA